MITVQLHLDDLQERIETTVRLLDETHPAGGGSAGPISREARGLVIVLLFAAYENLLTSLTRTLLEGAIRTRVGNKRLRPGLRAFALESAAKSLRNVSEKKVYATALPKLVETAAGGRVCTLDPNSFPSDGSFMKRSQIVLWCQLFDIPDPHLLLSKIWPVIDSVVSERNGIAHGRQTPDSVGRGYTESELRKLVDDWHDDWHHFLTEVGKRAQSRDFFRLP